MTRDRKAKQQVRLDAASSGRCYTEARRDDTANRRPPGSAHALSPAWMSRRDEPTFDERCHRLPWADVVLDGRDAADFWFPLPADPVRLPHPGAGVGDSGRLDLHLDGGAHLTVTAEVLRLTATRPAILVRVGYPDGHQLVTVSASMGDYRASAGQVWQTYLTRQPDGFARALAPRSMYPGVSERDHARAVRTGALVLRRAAVDPHGWYSPGTPPNEGWPNGNGVTELVRLASYGFLSHVDAEVTIQGWFDDEVPTVLDAQDAGFSMAAADDRSWVAPGEEWLMYHPRGWRDILRLRSEGWTIPALTVLHARLGEARGRELMARRRLDPFAVDLTEVTRLMWEAGEGEAWLAAAGSASAASRLIEQGLSLRDVEEGRERSPRDNG